MYVLKVDGIRITVDARKDVLEEEAKKYPDARIEIVPADSGDFPEFDTAGLNFLDFGVPAKKDFDEDSDSNFDDWRELDVDSM